MISPYKPRYADVMKALGEEIGKRRAIIIVETDESGFDIIRKGFEQEDIKFILGVISEDPLYGK